MCAGIDQTFLSSTFTVLFLLLERYLQALIELQALIALAFIRMLVQCINNSFINIRTFLLEATSRED